MRFISYTTGSGTGIGIVNSDGDARGLIEGDPHFPGQVHDLMQRGSSGLARAAAALRNAPSIDLHTVKFLPPVLSPGTKIICVGLNYADHTKESNYEMPQYPALFGRFVSSVVAHRAPLVKPTSSDQFDYEGELVAVIGKAGRYINRADALAYVAGYSLFNDGSVRDFQHRTPQWTMGKNFDGTGAFGPYFVTSDELPAGAKGLKLETRLNGIVVQSASTSDMVFDVVELIAVVSEAMTLLPGDLIVTGTPAGVGAGRKPPLFMKDGDQCEVDIEGLGILSNPIVKETDRKVT
jgi:acylpyruvate hydrolase